MSQSWLCLLLTSVTVRVCSAYSSGGHACSLLCQLTFARTAHMKTRTRAHACRGIDGVGVGICTSEGKSFK